MSSMGASFAEVYVMRKLHKEKMKKKEEERKEKGEKASSHEEKPSSGKSWRAKKIHPRSTPSLESDRKPGGTGN
uniref:Uncharacterized protein n=1 Tax=Nelumbo nucifera TaxID=4432 RepID=A0A822XRV5_NELNU|nr:TPA_asm: hypothetical protein HUJ06_023334 [Nelumbo nucifera]